jgi:hypothetical protein
MRKYLGMERSSSMDAVCDRSCDIFCHVQWNIHGADKSSMRTWNHTLLAANPGSHETSATRPRGAPHVRLFDEAGTLALGARGLANLPRKRALQ